VIERNVALSLPYMITENVLMAAVALGGDRQDLHERIRQHSHAVTQALKSGVLRNDLIARLAKDPAFAGVNFAGLTDQGEYTGRAAEQVREFLEAEIEPIRLRHCGHLNQQEKVSV
jgi:adenylosuccinate lyase